jgi:hypothetical protein
VNAEDKKCPDCGRPMKVINVLATAMWGDYPVKSELTYTVPEAKRSFWTGLFPAEGRVTACMCDCCGRILLYGEPRENGDEGDVKQKRGTLGHR